MALIFCQIRIETRIKVWDFMMDWLATISFDQIGMSFIALFVIREAIVFGLPDDIAGPGGWFIDTGCVDCEL
ncbi:hypothetical protein [Profundibacter sp.]